MSRNQKAQFVLTAPTYDKNTTHVCDNCGKVWRDSQLKSKYPDIEGLGERTSPGAEIPSGECPKCGALTYLNAESHSVSVTLKDVMRGDGKSKDLRLNLRITEEGVCINPRGYGDFCSDDGVGTPALLELADGVFRIVCWEDINQEDHTRVIEFGDAMESKREDDKEQDERSVCTHCGSRNTLKFDGKEQECHDCGSIYHPQLKEFRLPEGLRR